MDKDAALPSNNAKPRFYGTDSTEDLETLAEVTVEDDGTYALDVVQVDLKAETPNPSKGPKT